MTIYCDDLEPFFKFSHCVGCHEDDADGYSDLLDRDVIIDGEVHYFIYCCSLASIQESESFRDAFRKAVEAKKKQA